MVERHFCWVHPFNLDVTLSCGQAFRWEKKGEWWYEIVSGRVLKVRQIQGGIDFENIEVDAVKNYFGFNNDLSKIYTRINRDEYIGELIKRFEGLRVLRQDPWECLISYICAANKNFNGIKREVNNLARKFGAELKFENKFFYVFPSVETLARTSAAGLRECGLGYRAKYVLATAQTVLKEQIDLETLKKVSLEDARAELQKFLGVGLKVADCVLLFALNKLAAFPIDVWIKRAVLTNYTKNFPQKFVSTLQARRRLTRTEYEVINSFGRRYFGEYAGYAQEYIYYSQIERGVVR